MLGNELLENPHLKRAVRAAVAYASADPFSRSHKQLSEFEEAIGQFKGGVDRFIRSSRLSPEWIHVMDAVHRILTELSVRQSGKVQTESFLSGLQRMATKMRDSLEGEDAPEVAQIGEFLEQLQQQGLPQGMETVGGAAESVVNMVWIFLYALSAVTPLEWFLRESRG